MAWKLNEDKTDCMLFGNENVLKNYEQLKRVNAKFDEDMSIPLEKTKKESNDELDILSPSDP